MKKLLILLITFCIIPLSQAQLGIQFNEMTHNFGRVDQSKGTVTTKFLFKNTSNIPLRIISVRPYCGCTSSEFSHDTIFIGQSGFISAEFDPMKSMMGNFNKTIDVQFNVGTYKLSIAGSVYNSLQKAMVANSVVFSKVFSKLGTVYMNDVIKDTITITNPTEYEQSLKHMTSSTGNIQLEFSHKKLSPGTSATIYVTITMDDERMLGMGQSGFTLLTSDHRNPMMAITYEHNILQKFPKLTKKYLKNAPKFTVDKKEVDYDFVKAGSLHKTTFSIKNTGKDTLKIRKHSSACSCLSYELEKTTIAPGETVKLNSTFDTVLRNKGENTKYITLITNDPLHQEVLLKHFYILIP